MPSSNSEGQQDTRPRIQSVARASAVLQALARSRKGLAAREIASQVGLTRQTTYHLLHTLGSVGLVEKSSNSEYHLGLAVGALAEGFNRQLAPPPELLSQLEWLAGETGEASSIAAWRGDEVVVVAHVPGDHAVRVADVHTGQVGNAHARASGKALFSVSDPKRVESYLMSHPLAPLTPNTVTTRDALDKAIRRIRQQGYAIDNEEFSEGICCVASVATIGSRHYTFSISAPKHRFLENEQRYIDAVVKASKSSSRFVD